MTEKAIIKTNASLPFLTVEAANKQRCRELFNTRNESVPLRLTRQDKIGHNHTANVETLIFSLPSK